MTKNHYADLHAAVAQLVRVWAQGKMFDCAPELQPDGALALRLSVSGYQPASDDPDFTIENRTDEECAELLNRSRPPAKG